MTQQPTQLGLMAKELIASTCMVHDSAHYTEYKQHGWNIFLLGVGVVGYCVLLEGVGCV